MARLELLGTDQMLGQTNVDTTLNTYTQVLNDSVRAAVAPVGEELFRIVQSTEGANELIH